MFKDLPSLRFFDIAAAAFVGKPGNLLCSKGFLIDTEIHIHHGSAFKNRNVKWLVTDQSVSDLLLGDPYWMDRSLTIVRY